MVRRRRELEEVPDREPAFASDLEMVVSSQPALVVDDDVPVEAEPPDITDVAPASGTPSPNAGDVLRVGGTDYEVIRDLGAGGMAEVFLARRHGAAGFQREVALKRITPRLEYLNPADAANVRRMFIDEARLASHLHHPNIAQVFDLQEDRGTYYLVMEYVAGRSLSAALRLARKKRKALSEGFACYVAEKIARALHQAHRAAGPDGKPLGIVHRDVKPPNVMIDATGDVKLVDFGVAYSLLENRSETRTGRARGTPCYMSPEQADAVSDIDRRSDIFSLGVVLAEMLTGRRPFDAPGETATLMKVSRAETADVEAVLAGAPLVLRAILRKALSRKREDRQPDAEAFASELLEYMRERHLVYTSTDAARELEALEKVGEEAEPADAPAAEEAGAAAASAVSGAAVSAESPVTGPAAAAPLPSPVEGASQEKHLAALRERMRSPQKPTRKLVVPALVIAGVALIGNLLVWLVVSTNGSRPAEKVELTPVEERANREVALKNDATAPPVEPQLQALPPGTPALTPASAGGALSFAPREAPAAPSPAPPAGPAPGAGGTARSQRPRGSRQAAPPVQLAAAAPALAAADRVATAPVPAPVPAAPRRRFLDTSTISGASAPAAAAPGAPGGPSLPRGTLIAAKLATPADGANPGPVSATVTKDVKDAAGVVVIPKGAALLCQSRSSMARRVGIACDGVNLGGRIVAFSGSGLGADQRPGLAAGMAGGPGAGAPARDSAIGTAARVAGYAAPVGVLGELVQGAVEAGRGSAQAAAQGDNEVVQQPVPAGTAFYVYVNAFGA